ncbi:MAG TPA: protein-disulfide reductase DsbD domain-containing protein [Candidatus Krumholzibacteria bacterium]
MRRSSLAIRPYEPWRRAVLCTVALALGAPAARAGDDPLRPMSRAQVTAELVSDVAAIAPGSPFRLGVRLAMADGWHVNWINPGDAGLAPSIGWKLPDGFKAGIVNWPLPSRFDTGPLTIFGYGKDVLLMVDVKPPAGIAAGTSVELVADVSWLACAEECVPGSATVRLTLPVESAPRSDSEHRALFDATEARLPGHALAWSVDARIEQANTLVLQIQNGAAGGAPLRDIFFFPFEPGLIENAEPQAVSVHPGPAGQDVYELRIARARIPAGAMTKAHGILVAAAGLGAGEGPAAIEIDVPVSPR